MKEQLSGAPKHYGSYSVTIGSEATSHKNYSVTVGSNAENHSTYGIAIGSSSVTNENKTDSIVIGHSAKSLGSYSTAIGPNATLNDDGTVLLQTYDAQTKQYTLLYLIGAGTPLATTYYEDGSACLGYVVKQGNGTILECGTRRLSDLLIDNTAIATTSLESNPTPFMPTGITDPIIEPEAEEN
jgi:hypothetical protein